jgi:hypothetical protein
VRSPPLLPNNSGAGLMVAVAPGVAAVFPTVGDSHGDNVFTGVQLFALPTEGTTILDHLLAAIHAYPAARATYRSRRVPVEERMAELVALVGDQAATRWGLVPYVGLHFVEAHAGKAAQWELYSGRMIARGSRSHFPLGDTFDEARALDELGWAMQKAGLGTMLLDP